MGQAQINVRTRACSRTSIARTRQAALTHNVRGKELTESKCGSSHIQRDCGEGRTMSHLMTCVDAPNCTWTDLAMPTLAGVNCAKHWEESI